MKLVPFALDEAISLNHQIQKVDELSLLSGRPVFVVGVAGSFGTSHQADRNAFWLLGVIESIKVGARPSGIVLDFRDLNYESGDELGLPLQAAQCDEIRCRVISSPSCHAGLQALSQTLNHAGFTLSASMEDAVKVIEQEANNWHTITESIFLDKEPLDAKSYAFVWEEDRLVDQNEGFRHMVAKRLVQSDLRVNVSLWKQVLAQETLFAQRTRQDNWLNVLVNQWIKIRELDALPQLIEIAEQLSENNQETPSPRRLYFKHTPLVVLEKMQGKLASTFGDSKALQNILRQAIQQRIKQKIRD
jgi:hypothetical protein